MEPKLLTREQFREGTFARDNHRCVFCGKTGAETPEGKLDAHHIIERRLWTDGGYYLENGASVCEEHHLQCEMTVISVEEVREACGITSVPVLFDGLYEDCNFEEIQKSLNWESDEGYVVRVADSFTYGQFKNSIAKYVRKGHVQTQRHWRAGRQFIPNELEKK
jgi:hypothetical protein